ncbi:hypothetical protein EUGRSUZ_G00812 [Eucalyptus grandis]|uniref:Uncharacterized protein n=2 Tax=Eucalyptus grandis TaxID=71139 RepID=A0ACC3K0K3_EUCGR|nr:hypothetical protein EUGRSUZ_G00812 [Eucalyptus grandis]
MYSRIESHHGIATVVPTAGRSSSSHHAAPPPSPSQGCSTKLIIQLDVHPRRVWKSTFLCASNPRSKVSHF